MKEFVASLLKNPKYTFSSGKEMLEYFHDIIFKSIQPKLKDFFLKQPAHDIM